MPPKVSVIVCTYNNGKHIGQCIESILCQTFEDFEFIIVNDASTDNTHAIISSYSDSRIKYVKLDGNSGTIGKVRNISIGYATGEYIFFTDGDCHAKNDWIERGLSVFKSSSAVALEGKIVYNKDGYRRTLCDRDIENKAGGYWMCANMAFKKSILEEYRFNNNYKRLEDRELALRILKKHSIPFVADCIIYHQKITRGILQYIREATICDLNEKIKLVRELDDKNDIADLPMRIFNIRHLIILLFPPIILMEFWYKRVRDFNDVKLLPFVWIKAVYLRFHIWRTALKNRYLIL